MGSEYASRKIQLSCIADKTPGILRTYFSFVLLCFEGRIKFLGYISFQYLIGQLKNLRSNSKDYISREYSATNIEVTLSKQKEYCIKTGFLILWEEKKRKTIQEKTWFRVRPEFSVVILWSQVSS